MTSLNYKNYMINRKLNFEEAFYRRVLLSKFKKPRKDSKNKTLLELYNNTEIFKRRCGKERKNLSILRMLSFFISKKEIPFIDLKELILSNPQELKKLIDRYGKVDKKSTIYKILRDIFAYESKFQSDVITPFFTDNFDFKTCFYCNKDFITNFEKQKGVYTSTFQLDHFYDKGTYPYLALSFYNLIPSCATCNSKKVKGSESMINTIAPNSEEFKFHEKVKFKLYLDKNCKDLHVKDKDDIDIKLKEQFSKEYEKYIKVFKLNERYKAHKDIVYDMIEKAELYPDSRLKELQDLTGIPYQQIKKDIFNLIDEDEDLSKKPFSKLIKDISEELDLI
ncbi:hypothetical protein [Arcobacter sp. YIC-310]|uniref:hypothetical protein n=1 Tax=Arcobacter sp. YIC-310 TaxID=3376632 RepID=UPI003C2420E2